MPGVKAWLTFETFFLLNWFAWDLHSISCVILSRIIVKFRSGAWSDAVYVSALRDIYVALWSQLYLLIG